MNSWKEVNWNQEHVNHMKTFQWGEGELTRQIAPVWLLILGCQILVVNFIIGGSNGYWSGIEMSISKTPPSYGVPIGPLMVPRRCLEFDASKGVARTPEVSSERDTSFNSFVRRVSAADILLYLFTFWCRRKLFDDIPVYFLSKLRRQLFPDKKIFRCILSL